jgi:menaquinone-dependent protoporphyrinogen oxidase
MADILILYGTSEGQTAKVADRIASTLADLGHTPETVDITRRSVDLDLADYDAVLVGASIHMGKHQKGVKSFVNAHRNPLETLPSGFFQVSLSAAIDDAEHHEEAMGYIDDLIETTEWQPERIALFGGAIRYSEYGFITRSLMKSIAKQATGDIDTSQDYEYTDWDEVDRFTEEFAGFVEDQLTHRGLANREEPVQPN